MAFPVNNWLLKKKRALRGPVFVPAVDISVVSLLQALIPLAEQIIQCERPRWCQRRNAICITRKIMVLSMFFEEVRDEGVAFFHLHCYASENYMLFCRRQNIYWRTVAAM